MPSFQFPKKPSTTPTTKPGRELHFSYKSGADALAGVQMPVSLGPYSYSLAIAPEGVNNVMRNATELAFELRDVAINEEGIPPL